MRPFLSVGHIVRKVSLFRLIYWVIALGIIGSLIWYTHMYQNAAPPDAPYSYATGHLGDFYGYSYMIRRGQEGHILYKNVYSGEQTSEVLSQPFFHILGMISRPFAVAPGFIFTVARLVGWLALFGSVCILIERTIQKESTKILAGVFFLSSTSIFDIRAFFHNGTIVTPTMYNDYFDLFSKYVRIPPHHLVSFVCMIGILLGISAGGMRRFTFLILLILAACIGLLQPYISFFLGIILGTYLFIHWISSKRLPHNTPLIISIIGISIVMVLLNYYLLQHVLRLPFASTGAVSTPRYITFGTYLTALGPLVWVSLLVFWNRSMSAKPMVKLLVLWAWVPCIFFLLPEIGNVTSTNRLLQTYQQLPCAILAAIGADAVLNNYRYRVALVLVLSFLSLSYGFVSYAGDINQDLHAINTAYFNVYIPKYLSETFSYIDSHTPADSMMLGGTSVSAMVPAFTHSRVFIGHDSNTPNYSQKVGEAMAFYQGTMTDQEVKRFVSSNHIAYIMFGLDAPLWSESRYNGAGYLTLTYTNGPVQVIRVE